VGSQSHGPEGAGRSQQASGSLCSSRRGCGGSLRCSADRRVERLEERLHAQEVQAQERARLEAVRRAEEAEEQRRAAEAERARQAAAAAAAAAAQQQRALEHIVVLPAQPRDDERPWWQRAWDTVREAARSAVAWVDQHQTAVAIGIGVAAGVAAVLLTGGLAAPLVVGALAAGGVSALGTVGLNAYYLRPLGTNVLRNVGLSAGAAVLTTGAGLAVRTGLAVRAAFAVGNTVAGLCGRNPVACTRAEGVLRALDTAEELGLQAQLALQIAAGDPRAGETALELQLEYMDGGAPGNTVVREFDDAADAARIASPGDGEALQEAADSIIQWLDVVPPRYRASVAEAFDGTPEVVTLTEDLIVYRRWGGDAPEIGSPWFSPEPYLDAEEARRYLALPENNAAEQVSAFRIPAGTTLVQGSLAGWPGQLRSIRRGRWNPDLRAQSRRCRARRRTHSHQVGAVGGKRADRTNPYRSHQSR
jgi:VIT1/CCC1 family predicted Fe2+/Mn2+ transporter